jgi:integrase
MKAKKEHRVPLSPRALEIARDMLSLKGDYPFPGAKDRPTWAARAARVLLLENTFRIKTKWRHDYD